jgi:hypothetical protein
MLLSDAAVPKSRDVAAAEVPGVRHGGGRRRLKDSPGGRAAPAARCRREARPVRRIDSGPTVLTMAGLLEQTFAAAGAALDDHLTLRPLDPEPGFLDDAGAPDSRSITTTS